MAARLCWRSCNYEIFYVLDTSMIAYRMIKPLNPYHLQSYLWEVLNSDFSSDISIVLCPLLYPCSKDGWEKRWVKSDWKKDDNTAGEWKHTAGNWSGDANDKGMFHDQWWCWFTDSYSHVNYNSLAGIQTSEDYRFYAISAEFPEFSNKDKTLVFQFSVKHEQKLDCGGGYMKLLSDDVDQTKFGGDTPYRCVFRLLSYQTSNIQTPGLSFFFYLQHYVWARYLWLQH